MNKSRRKLRIICCRYSNYIGTSYNYYYEQTNRLPKECLLSPLLADIFMDNLKFKFFSHFDGKSDTNNVNTSNIKWCYVTWTMSLCPVMRLEIDAVGARLGPPIFRSPQIYKSILGISTLLKTREFRIFFINSIQNFILKKDRSKYDHTKKKF